MLDAPSEPSTVTAVGVYRQDSSGSSEPKRCGICSFDAPVFGRVVVKGELGSDFLWDPILLAPFIQPRIPRELPLLCS